MSPFADGSVNDSTESVKENSALASIDCVKRRVENGGGGANTESCASEVVKKGNRCLAATHCGGWWLTVVGEEKRVFWVSKEDGFRVYDRWIYLT